SPRPQARAPRPPGGASAARRPAARGRAAHCVAARSGRRLLIIRSLDVGTIRGSQSAASVALAVEQRMAALAPSAVHAAAPEAEWAPAVYFRDAVEPYVLL